MNSFFIGAGVYASYLIPVIFIILIVVIVERFLKFSSLSFEPESTIKSIAILLQDRKIAEAVEQLKKSKGILARVLEVGLYRFDKDRNEIEAATRNFIIQSKPEIMSNIGALKIIAAISPLIGISGAVSMLAKNLAVISQSSPDIPAILNVIADSAAPLAGGLIISVIAVIAYGFFSAKAKNMISIIESAGAKLAEMITMSRKDEPFPEDLLGIKNTRAQM